MIYFIIYLGSFEPSIAQKMKYKYRIIIKLPDIKLNFRIQDYEVMTGGYYKFFDDKTQTYRIFDSRICEIIEEVLENE